MDNEPSKFDRPSKSQPKTTLNRRDKKYDDGNYRFGETKSGGRDQNFKPEKPKQAYASLNKKDPKYDDGNRKIGENRSHDTIRDEKLAEAAKKIA